MQNCSKPLLLAYLSVLVFTFLQVGIIDQSLQAAQVFASPHAVLGVEEFV